MFLAAACGADQAKFRPTENVSATGTTGQPAAAYDVRSDSRQLAHVKVWSRGAHEVQDGRTVVRLAAEVQNVGDQPISLARDQLRLAAFGEDGNRLPATHLVSVAPGTADGSLVVGPGQVATFDLQFATSTDIDPDRIEGMRLRWGLSYDDERRYLQFTEFRQVPERTYASTVYYDPVYGFYDPFLYGPPYGFRHYLHYHYPVGRVIVVERERPARTRQRDEGSPGGG